MSPTEFRYGIAATSGWLIGYCVGHVIGLLVYEDLMATAWILFPHSDHWVGGLPLHYILPDLVILCKLTSYEVL